MLNRQTLEAQWVIVVEDLGPVTIDVSVSGPEGIEIIIKPNDHDNIVVDDVREMMATLTQVDAWVKRALAFIDGKEGS